MNIEQAKEELKVEYLGDTDRIRKAKDIAIKSLDMWDKVIEEMKYFYNIYDSYDEEELTKEELWTVSLGKRHYKHALYIINKHLGE